jgi:hypothetical protein
MPKASTGSWRRLSAVPRKPGWWRRCAGKGLYRFPWWQSGKRRSSAISASVRCSWSPRRTPFRRWGWGPWRSGHQAVVVLGQPEYYARFGFLPAGNFGLECEFKVSENFFWLWSFPRKPSRAHAAWCAISRSFPASEPSALRFNHLTASFLLGPYGI